MPLRELNDRVASTFDGKLIGDAAYAFSGTLENLKVTTPMTSRSLYGGQGRRAFDRTGTLVVCWTVPRLSYLVVDYNYNFVRIHLGLLACCPKLVTLLLKDTRSSNHWTHDISRWDHAVLRHLWHLTLQGTSALSFNPETLGTTDSLQHLELMMVQTYNVSSPDVSEEIFDCHSRYPVTGAALGMTPNLISSERQIWTWGWDLPNLTTLT